MTVEKGVGGAAAAAEDQFPTGMRVLAVDDDPTCLLLLETLLRRCQYHVTTTSQAIKALDMLRRNKFDLVISDVHMPEMDGFKLLEHVGLEMDLPVIMLSANSDPKLVMKGITHGACDYLLKPVRIEELKNIWQHVVRRRKFDSKERNNSENKEKPPHGSDEGATDQRLGKRRKDQNEDEDEERDDSGQENEDSTTQKKPRVVWSVDLHQKFVAAVNQLGIDKAVPKKILDLMNVEKLTRENVASHLQKYRLYLKKISTVANQQANMVAALGSTDSSYLHINSMSGLGFHGLTGSTQLQSASLRSIPPNGILSRLNSPAGLGMHGLQSPGVIQLSPAQATSQSSNSKSLFQPVIHGGNRGNIFQGRPMSLELDQMQCNKGITFPREFPTGLEEKTAFPVPNGFPDARMFSGSSNSPLHGVANKTLMLEGCHQGPQDVQQFGKQSSVAAAALNSGFSSHVSDLGRSTDSWSSVVQSTGMQSNLFTPRQGVVCPGNITDSISTMAFASGSDVASMLSVQLEDSKGGLRCQLSSNGGNAGQVINNNTQGWDNHRHEANILTNALCSSSVTPFDGTPSSLGQNFDTNTPISHAASSFSPVGQSNFVDNILLKHDTANSALESLVLKDGYMMGQQKLQNNYISSNFSSFEDLVVGMADRDQDKMRLAEGEFGSGAYPVRTCI